MIQILLVGLSAGAASALLLAALASGSLLAILLFCMSPLPIMIAAVGFSHWAGLVAAVAAALGLSAAFGSPMMILTYLLGVGLPAWWLGYLALLARPAEDGRVEWYPAERLLLWCAGIAALMVILTIPNFGLTEEEFRGNLRKAFEFVLTDRSRGSGAPPPDLDQDSVQRLIAILVAVMPLAAAVLATVTNSLNLYLAGRIAKVSGRLARPWPDLPALRFPTAAHVGFGVALVVSFMPGLVGTVGGIVAAALTMAYGLLGFAVLHAITRGVGGRLFILIGAYALVLTIGWPIVALALLGVADAIFDFRKAAGSAPPPAGPGTT